ncbi:MAG TPA: PTS sugar transporter subunit IIA [Nitrospirota bacterium]|nr:PTS sugar transporter subunit IIA [Nitrospirota bacterium]
MVSIKDHFQNDLVIDDIKAVDKNGVLREFAGLLKTAGKVREEDGIVRVLAEREALGSTGIGDGVAIPHGKVRGLREIVVAFGRSRNGVDFQSLDGKPVHLFFLLLTPEDNPGDHLKVLARISRLLKNPVLREDLRAALPNQDVRKIILDEDSKYLQK